MLRFGYGVDFLNVHFKPEILNSNEKYHMRLRAFFGNDIFDVDVTEKHRSYSESELPKGYEYAGVIGFQPRGRVLRSDVLSEADDTLELKGYNGAKALFSSLLSHYAKHKKVTERNYDPVMKILKRAISTNSKDVIATRNLAGNYYTFLQEHGHNLSYEVFQAVKKDGADYFKKAIEIAEQSKGGVLRETDRFIELIYGWLEKIEGLDFYDLVRQHEIKTEIQ